MSAKHAVITCEADVVNPHVYNVTITDHSRHGVMVNKKKIPAGKPHELQHEDLVTLPFGMEYRFEVVRRRVQAHNPSPRGAQEREEDPRQEANRRREVRGEEREEIGRG